MAYDYSVIGKRIRRAREEKGLTQEALAEQLDVSNAYISKIERGRTPINLDRLSELCVVLEETPEYLLSGANRSSQDFLRGEIMEMLEGCSPEKIRLISQVIRPIVDFKEKE
ncbi:helix-turn-helix domain-containing protein [Paenibacillus pasadenensis]|uniref:Putative transcriptional regulator n=1 Tax=Paenibacillus pasadenensis TaxID=217090 RepID=A0A2N5N4S8_9BACL|nr:MULTISPECIES: helix-turn-helix transcriptional regulator [Paenibacillus]PLT45320.1 putative transcriptional regulator [Paenibacillus pasadenensis]QGG55715.1 helix-turn-helix domain-containing protein [Paenibacillus sp. B01]